jgi:hypothetical protein
MRTSVTRPGHYDDERDGSICGVAEELRTPRIPTLHQLLVTHSPRSTWPFGSGLDSSVRSYGFLLAAETLEDTAMCSRFDDAGQLSDQHQAPRAPSRLREASMPCSMS